MFRNYNINTTDNDENTTEIWSCLAGFQRFNSANVPRSRLGKRRTVNRTTEVKRSILNGISTNSRVINKYDCTSKTSSLTHPVNSLLTPNYKKDTKPSDRNCEASNGNTDCDIKNGPLTPFRNVDSNPLGEVNNFLHGKKIILSAGKPSNVAQSIHQQQEQSDINKILNKSFEDEKIPSPTEDCSQFHIGRTHSDSSHSDMCDNSSFMTAHDVYNLEKNRSCRDFIKTPGKGYCLFDTVVSPIDTLSNQTDEDNDSFHNFLVKTPRLARYDSLHTPYRSEMKHDYYTPFKSNRTPAGNRHLEGVPEKAIEDEVFDDNTQDRVQKLEDDIRNKCNIVSQNKLPLKDNEKEKPKPADLSVDLKMDLTTLDAAGNNIKIPITDVAIEPPPSNEKSVKRQIFEGLGWTFPPASFAIESPIIEAPSNLVKNAPCTSNLETANFSNLENPVLHKTEPEMSPKLDIFDKPLIKNNIAKSNTASKSISCRGESGESSKSLSSSNMFDVARDERLSFKMEEPSPMKSLNISGDPKRHDLPIRDEASNINSLSSSSTYPSKTLRMVTGEANVIAPSLQQSLTLNNTKVSPLKNASPDEKDCTLDSQQKEETAKKTYITNTAEHNSAKTIEKFYDTVILKPPVMQNIEQKPVERSHDKIQPPQQISNKECLINDVPIFGCQRQINMPPQTNIVYVNKKPFTVLSMLGRGGSSEVYQVLEANSSKLMALKFVNLSSVEEAVAKGYLNEIEVLSKLQGCPSVIKMFDNEYISENKILYVLMEKGDTDFSRLMKDIMKTKKISMPMIIYYWTEMLNAVKDIHDRGIIHSDLKPANFLLVSGRLKLIDFGIASSLQGDMTSVLKDVTTGTFNYMSPEAIRNSGETRGYKINYKSDIWSLGCILYNLLYGRTPFSHLSNTWAKLQAIADPETSVSFPPGSTAPPHLLLSVRWALLKDPKQRPTAEELLRLAELTPGPETRLGRQISSLFGEYIYQMFPNCKVRFEAENPKDLKQSNSNLLH